MFSIFRDCTPKNSGLRRKNYCCAVEENSYSKID